MEIEEKFYEIAQEIIDTLSFAEVKSIVDEFEIEHLMSGEQDQEDLKDFLNEDYAYVLPVMKFLLLKRNLTIIEVGDECDSCDDYRRFDFDISSGEMKCKECGTKQKYII